MLSPPSWAALGLCNWGRRILLMRADAEKVGLQNWGFSGEKKCGKNNRTKPELLLINMIQLDPFSIVVLGFWSEMF